jgi:iron complex outermembrane receptor protein
VNGQLFELPGGALRMAVGAEYRDEGRTRRRTSFTSGLEPADVSPQELGRDVTAVFGELYLPAFGQANRRPGFEELALSIAGRSERYSDFGSSTDPRVGLAWAPVEGLRLRGTYGTSFRAPNLTDFGSDYSAALFAVVDPTNTVTGRTLALTLQGPRDDLTPETSTSWTAGVELLPGFASGLQIKATYFDIDFENRVSRLPGNPFNALTQEEALASVITRNPDASLVEALATDAARFRDYSGGAPLSDVRVIIDARISNIAVTRISGVDFIAQYRHASHAGDFDFGLNLTYLKEYRQAITPTAPLVDFRDTLNNPIALRGRANVGWSRGNWSTTAFVNYADSYRNNTFDPERKIDSWTTLDLHLRYDLDGWGDVLRGTALSLNVQNLFDENPPLALDAAAPNVSAGLAYDSENADPLGRFVALQISKTW